MEIKTNGGEYNPCQYGLTVNLAPDSKVLSRSEMYVVRGETPEEVHKAFLQLQILINGKKENSEKKPGNASVKQNGQKIKAEQSCPECGGLLLEKQGISSKTKKPYHFWGCGSFPACTFTRPAERIFDAPDEDLIVTAIPF